MKNPSLPAYVSGDRAIHCNSREVTVGGQPVQFSPTEYSLTGYRFAAPPAQQGHTPPARQEC